MDIRVRFAPSPTGPFSLGNARTALFNWLFAKHEGGKFLLRIEDTDRERSKKKYERDILAALKWLGLGWDEEIVRQSGRADIYEKYLDQLLANSNAYWCFCTPEELELERQAQLSQGLPPKYGGKCRNLTAAEVKRKLKISAAVIRFKIPETKVSFQDLIRGKVEFDASLIGDIIIARGLREPLYNFATAVDDVEMKISHVIRGEDHLSNTPKQILIQKALGFQSPQYAHLPLILGPDRKKLSKRFLDKSLIDYRHDGYLKEAFLNFLVLLGWHPERDREVISLSEMIAEFDLKRVQKSGAIFNPEKLDWLNAQYIKSMPAEELVRKLSAFLPKEWLADKPFLLKVTEVEKNRLKKLRDFRTIASFFFALPDYPSKLLIWQKIPEKVVIKNLKTVLEKIEAIPEEKFNQAAVRQEIGFIAEKLGRGEVLWPLRVALSGLEASPDPMELIYVLGRKETLRRIKIAIQKLSG